MTIRAQQPSTIFLTTRLTAPNGQVMRNILLFRKSIRSNHLD